MSLIGFAGCDDKSTNSNASDVSQEGENTPDIKDDDSSKKPNPDDDSPKTPKPDVPEETELNDCIPACQEDEQCSDHKCVPRCTDNNTYCNGECLDLEALHLAGCDSCAEGFADADSNLVNGCEIDSQSDVIHCEDPDFVCPEDSSCEDGICVCSPDKELCSGACVILEELHLASCDSCAEGFADADSNLANGCEIDSQSNVIHCEDPDFVCPEDSSCEDGICVCSPDKELCSGACVVLEELHLASCDSCAEGFADADSNLANGCEIESQSDVIHCEGPDFVCPEDSSCEDGKCVCSPDKELCNGSCVVLEELHLASCNSCAEGFGDADSNLANGCEIDFRSDVNHCGGPDIVCPEDSSCENGKCVCSPDKELCNGSCVVLKDLHLASCNSCAEGFGDADSNLANGCEINFQNDKNNCGSPGIVCPDGIACKNGTCDCGKDKTFCNGACISLAALHLATCDKCANGFADDDKNLKNGCELNTRFNNWKIENGKFYDNGKWVFIKNAKPLLDWSSSASLTWLKENLKTLKEKNYTSVELNCYWHHFDTNGDGKIDDENKKANIRKAIDAIYDAGLYPCIGVETYSVGGGNIPDGFWKSYPGAMAKDSNGQAVRDDEYGFNTAVVSIHNTNYQKVTRDYIKDLANSVDTRKILWFETTVEPQYMGNRDLDFSDNAKTAYNAWKKAYKEANPNDNAAPDYPSGFPIPNAFITNPYWDRFRGEALADWIKGDAAAWREVVTKKGGKGYVAVDFLYVNERQERQRHGSDHWLLRRLFDRPNAQACPVSIIQLNWHWNLEEKKPNTHAYDLLYSAMKDKNCSCAVTEHMTLNGDSFTGYSTDMLNALLENTLQKGTRFGWDFTSVTPSSENTFSLYNNDWSPKPTIKVVDNNWTKWKNRVVEIENSKK